MHQAIETYEVRKDLDFNKAKYWFKKIVDAGNESATGRLQALEATVTCFEKEEKLNEAQ